MSEYKLQVAVIVHIRNVFPQVRAIHIPNQSRDATEAYFNKQMGVEPGTSDLLIGWKGRNVGVLELKYDKGRISTAQNKFLSWADSIGWSTGVAYSVKQTHDILIEWGLQPLHHVIQEPDYSTKEEKFEAVMDFYKP